MAVPKKATKKSPQKRAVKKAVAKKSVKKKTPTPKKTVKSAPKMTSSTRKTTKQAPKKVSKVKSKSRDETVVLPTDAGERLVAKAEATRRVFLEDFSRAAFLIAYVSAFCFIFVGAATIFSHFNFDTAVKHQANVCTALTGCSDETGINTSNTAVVETGSAGLPVDPVGIATTVSVDPEFTLNDSVPSIVTDDLKLSFSVINGINVTANLLSTNSGGLTPLQVKRLSDQNYQIEIPGSTLPAGEYSIKVFVTKVDGTGAFSYPGGRFTVESQTASLSTPQTDVSTSSSSSQDASSADATSDGSGASDTTSTTPVESVSQANVDDEIGYIQLKPVETQSDFIISSYSQVFSDREAVRVIAPSSYDKVELYIRSERSIEARFLGTMSKEFDRWLYAFDSINLPNGKYELFAVGFEDTQKITSDSVPVLVQNIILDVEPVRIEAPDSATKPTEPNRNFYLYETSVVEEDDADASQQQPGISAREETEKIFEENEPEINDLLKRYAVAVQGGNEVMIDAIEVEIQEQRNKIVTDVVLDPLTTNISSQINSEIESKFVELKERVETFEKIRQSRSTSIDSDNDGVSDTDEIKVFKTDPNNPDSDNDGFIDGAEIIGGFDPNNEVPEVFVAFELPQETIGLERKDVMKITKVQPVVEMDESLQTSKVQAEISGVGLPNSFVTIYVFSTPVIVTVKTDADGSFVYRFDKELEDGEHEVYVAFTDNTGSILAHSEPFQFVKEAQAFTPVDASEEVVVTAAPVTETAANEAYRLVLGLIVLVLGVILLMLGINIRSDENKVASAHSS